MRVAASHDRSEEPISLDAQRRAIETWAARQGIAIASWKADDGISGATPIAERPGLVAAYGDVRHLGAGVLVAAKRDRFACDAFVAGLVEQAALASGAMLQTADTSLLPHGRGQPAEDRATQLDASRASRTLDASGQPGDQSFTRGALDLYGAYQRAINRQRTREALAAKRSRNERIGTVPYGYRLAADRLHLEPDAAEQAVLRRVRELAAEGKSQREICEDLAAHGVMGRTGAPLQKTQVARMLLRVAV